jgi:xylulokinase
VQEVPAQTIGASYGDALMAGIGGGHLPAETDWAVTGAVVEPRPETREVYDALYADYGQLYPLTKDMVHRLARLQEREFPSAAT